MFDPVKLKFAQYQQREFHNVPVSLRTALQEWATAPNAATPPDLQVYFVLDLAEMATVIQTIAANKRLAPKGYLYVAYPKLSSTNYPGIHRDDIFPYLHVDQATGEVAATGLKFSRMVSFDDDFTIVGLKWLQQAPRRAGASQRVADYEAQLPTLIERLQATPKEAALFAGLTPGYQRDWTRFVYAAKTEATRQAHFKILLSALVAGDRSVAQYQKRRAAAKKAK